jgi:hypothetical protein
MVALRIGTKTGSPLKKRRKAFLFKWEQDKGLSFPLFPFPALISLAAGVMDENGL